MHVALKALLAQLAASFLTASVWWLVWKAGATLHFSGWLLLQAGTATTISWRWRLPSWWLLIQLLFLPLVVSAYLLALPSWYYLIAFVLFYLLFRSNTKERVPLYLSNRQTASAVASLLPETPGLHIVDLGCGTGSLLHPLSVLRPDAWLFGVESAPLPYLLAKWRMRARRHCNIRFGDLWGEDLSSYDVVYAFLSPEPMGRLWQQVSTEMRPGSLFISNSFEVPGCVPHEILEVDDTRQTRLLIWRL